jgi:glucan phosphorylase
LENRVRPGLNDLNKGPKQIYGTLEALKEGDLISGFARRFATDKRADLLFRDIGRLSKLMNHKTRPVKLIFAGKAHPADQQGQALIKRIIEISERPEFIGKVIFVQNYDMALARLMVQGADIWLNTPQRGKEASGTSGMKAVLNGTLNFSVQDGWWAEAYRSDSGWALSKEKVYENNEDQNDLDAETIYNILEQEIIPEYYELNDKGIPEKWIDRIKNAFTNIAPSFSTTRMLHEYTENYYAKMHGRVKKMKKNNYEGLRNMVGWMKNINTSWDAISVVDVQVPDNIKPLELGEKFEAEVTLDLGGLSPEDIGVELVFAKRSENGDYRIRNIQELKYVSQKKHHVRYKGQATASLTGAFQYGIRFFPKNAWLTYRRDLPLVEWI